MGRPKKHSRKKKNPFDFANLGVKKGCKKVSYCKFRKGPIKFPCQVKHTQRLETIIENVIISREEKAKSIIDCAQVLGVQVNLELPEEIIEVSYKLEEGKL